MQATKNGGDKAVTRRKKNFPLQGRERGKAAPIVRSRPTVSSAAKSVLESGEHVYSESGIAEVHALREKKVREDIARRLKKVCADFSEDEFERLVTLMAALQVRCERRQTW